MKKFPLLSVLGLLLLLSGCYSGHSLLVTDNKNMIRERGYIHVNPIRMTEISSTDTILKLDAFLDDNKIWDYLSSSKPQTNLVVYNQKSRAFTVSAGKSLGDTDESTGSIQSPIPITQFDPASLGTNQTQLSYSDLIELAFNSQMLGQSLIRRFSNIKAPSSVHRIYCIPVDITFFPGTVTQNNYRAEVLLKFRRRTWDDKDKNTATTGRVDSKFKIFAVAPYEYSKITAAMQSKLKELFITIAGKGTTPGGVDIEGRFDKVIRNYTKLQNILSRPEFSATLIKDDTILFTYFGYSEFNGDRHLMSGETFRCELFAYYEPAGTLEQAFNDDIGDWNVKTNQMTYDYIWQYTPANRRYKFDPSTWFSSFPPPDLLEAADKLLQTSKDQSGSTAEKDSWRNYRYWKKNNRLWVDNLLSSQVTVDNVYLAGDDASMTALVKETGRAAGQAKAVLDKITNSNVPEWYLKLVKPGQEEAAAAADKAFEAVKAANIKDPGIIATKTRETVTAVTNVGNKAQLACTMADTVVKKVNVNDAAAVSAADAQKAAKAVKEANTDAAQKADTAQKTAADLTELLKIQKNAINTTKDALRTADNATDAVVKALNGQGGAAPLAADAQKAVKKANTGIAAAAENITAVLTTSANFQQDNVKLAQTALEKFEKSAQDVVTRAITGWSILIAALTIEKTAEKAISAAEEAIKNAKDTPKKKSIKAAADSLKEASKKIKTAQKAIAALIKTINKEPLECSVETDKLTAQIDDINKKIKEMKLTIKCPPELTTLQKSIKKYVKIITDKKTEIDKLYAKALAYERYWWRFWCHYNRKIKNETDKIKGIDNSDLRSASKKLCASRDALTSMYMEISGVYSAAKTLNALFPKQVLIEGSGFSWAKKASAPDDVILRVYLGGYELCLDPARAGTRTVMARIHPETTLKPDQTAVLEVYKEKIFLNKIEPVRKLLLAQKIKIKPLENVASAVSETKKKIEITKDTAQDGKTTVTIVSTPAAKSSATDSATLKNGITVNTSTTMDGGTATAKENK
ncbi:MAG: hypothetical protein PHH77_11610 [Victivallaceae bacterium]|nr:hypothetical protein [Victivallaceae bacterium]